MALYTVRYPDNSADFDVPWDYLMRESLRADPANQGATAWDSDGREHLELSDGKWSGSDGKTYPTD